MQKLVLPSSVKSATGIIVEVIGRDGLMHHVGPFKSRDEAEAWMAQALPKNAPSQDDVAAAPATWTI